MLKSAHTPADQGCRALQQCQEVGGGLFIAHQQLAEAIEPRVGAFNHPAAGAMALPTGTSFFPALPHVRRITSGLHGFRGRTPRITFVRTQVLSPAAADFWAHDHNAVQSDRQQFDIMPVGPADDKGQRDASPVHQQAALAAFFSPDPWGCCPPPPVPAALCLGSHQCFATPRQSLPFHHTRPTLPATGPGKTPARASVESVCEPNWRCRTIWAAPSTGSQCAAHKQCRRRFDGRPRASVRHRDDAGNACGLGATAVGEPGAGRAARVHRKLPTIEFWPCRQHITMLETTQLYLRISSYSAIMLVATLALAGCSRSTPVTITNRSGNTLSNIVVTGTGFTNRIESILAGAKLQLTVHATGKLEGLRVVFDAAGQKIDSGDLGYLDSMLSLSVIIDTNFSVTASAGAYKK